ncbi:hypothetical protein SAMN04488543_4112 [Friedmanniella luteola]|uniref:Uncharacterized protein n=1 Tax=Friedmanniella luteola TaxID=546871 RepID=A0A1H1ZZD6_9ACTN|nr:hypothetical protein [Friedmanniella luteola]SDT39074.1 hypothetical protein SAMN04488543_4112 [Friedmanniella luteola]
MSNWIKDKLDAVTGSGDGDASEGGQVSSAGSSFEDAETSGGGADSVPGTPDATPSADLGRKDVDRAEGAS